MITESYNFLYCYYASFFQVENKTLASAWHKIKNSGGGLGRCLRPCRAHSTSPGLLLGPRASAGLRLVFSTFLPAWRSARGSDSSQGTPLPTAASACLSGHEACGYRAGASELPLGQASGPTLDRAPLTRPGCWAAGGSGTSSPPPHRPGCPDTHRRRPRQG